ncbi:MAG TPA: hypothetical protein VH678_30455 [Xanthobacteraceae bacterium]|jgi:hypothetical protein
MTEPWRTLAARARWVALCTVLFETDSGVLLPPAGRHPLDAKQDARRAADEQARQELGDIHQLIDIGEPATIDGLMKELDVKERLDGMINRCLKQLLMVRGIKSLSSGTSSTAPRQIAGARKAG